MHAGGGSDGGQTHIQTIHFCRAQPQGGGRPQPHLLPQAADPPTTKPCTAGQTAGAGAAGAEAAATAAAGDGAAAKAGHAGLREATGGRNTARHGLPAAGNAE